MTPQMHLFFHHIVQYPYTDIPNYTIINSLSVKIKYLLNNMPQKDYINNAYQSHSTFKPYRGPLQFDSGIPYNERPGWHGNQVESISQAMFDRTFQPLGWRPST